MGEVLKLRYGYQFGEPGTTPGALQIIEHPEEARIVRFILRTYYEDFADLGTHLRTGKDKPFLLAAYLVSFLDHKGIPAPQSQTGWNRETIKTIVKWAQFYVTGRDGHGHVYPPIMPELVLNSLYQAGKEFFSHERKEHATDENENADPRRTT
jgi:hypothetical protein